MKNKKLLNVLLFLITIALPVLLPRVIHFNSKIETIVFFSTTILILLGSTCLVIVNEKNRRMIKKDAWLWVAFEVIGVLGFCYSASMLFLVYALRNCCGF